MKLDKYAKFGLIILLVLGIFILISCTQKQLDNSQDSLKISITSDKSSYILGEEIYINLSIENIGTEKITLFNLFNVTEWLLFEFKIKNPNGTMLEYNGPMIDKAIMKRDFIELLPNQKISFITELTGCYHEICVYDFSTLGDYDISFKYALSGNAKYEEQDEKGFLTGNKTYIETWKGETQSNLLKIRIMPN